MQLEVQDRLQVVCDLLELRILPEVARTILGQYSWDFDGHPVILERRHITSLLGRYSSKATDELVVAEWADVIELRDDIKPEMGFEDLILEIIFELANPILNGQLSTQRAQELVLLISPDNPAS